MNFGTYPLNFTTVSTVKMFILVFFSASDVKLVPELTANKNLVVTRPDKGNGVVILDKEAYIGSMEGIAYATDKFSVICVFCLSVHCFIICL